MCIKLFMEQKQRWVLSSKKSSSSKASENEYRLRSETKKLFCLNRKLSMQRSARPSFSGETDRQSITAAYVGTNLGQRWSVGSDPMEATPEAKRVIKIHRKRVQRGLSVDVGGRHCGEAVMKDEGCPASRSHLSTREMPRPHQTHHVINCSSSFHHAHNHLSMRWGTHGTIVHTIIYSFGGALMGS